MLKISLNVLEIHYLKFFWLFLLFIFISHFYMLLMVHRNQIFSGLKGEQI